MVDWQVEVFKALAPIDIVNLFPADPGACSCEDYDGIGYDGGYWGQAVLNPVGSIPVLGTGCFALSG